MLEITPFPGQPVLQALRELYLEGRDGVLEVAHATGQQMLLLRAGSLHATAQDAVGERLAGAARGGAHRAPAARHRALERTADRAGARCARERGAHEPRALPVAELLMAAATLGRSEAQLLDLLGGEEARLATRVDAAGIARVPGLEPEDAFLLSRLERTMSVGELLRQARGERAATLGRLSRLRAVGLIGAAERRAAAPGEDTRQLLERFAARVEADLQARPLALGKEEHRRGSSRCSRASALRATTSCSASSPTPTNEALHRAYLELARLVHPRHAASLELSEGAAALELLFERATEAYLVLTDPAAAWPLRSRRRHRGAGAAPQRGRAGGGAARSGAAELRAR